MVFRAAHGVAEDDTRPTGPRQQAAADRRAQVDLNKRVNAAIDTSYRTAWTPIAEQVGLTPGADPHWPILAENLAALSRAGADAPTLLRQAAAEAPAARRVPGRRPLVADRPARLPRRPHPRPLRRAAGPATPGVAGPAGRRPRQPPDVDRAGATAALMQDPRWPAVITASPGPANTASPTPTCSATPSAPTANPSPGTPWPTP